MSKKLNILILSATENKNNKKIRDEAAARGHSVQILAPDDVVISYAGATPVIYIKEQEVDKKYFDVIIPRLGRSLQFGVHILRHFKKFYNVVMTADPEGILKASDKLRTTLELSAAGISIPMTTTVRTPDNFKFLVDTVGGLPCIGKTVTGSQGNGVYIFETELQSSVTLKNLRRDRKNLLMQEFIETAEDDDRKNDIRAWVVGDKVVAAFKRLSTDSDFRSNYSISKAGETVELTTKEQKMAVEAAQALGLPCAGVDIARDANNDWKPCVIEVNSNASLTGIEKVTGVNISKYIIDWVEQKHSEKIRENNTSKNHYVTTMKYGGTVVATKPHQWTLIAKKMSSLTKQMSDGKKELKDIRAAVEVQKKQMADPLLVKSSSLTREEFAELIKIDPQAAKKIMDETELKFVEHAKNGDSFARW